MIRTNFLFGMPLDRDYNSSGLKRGDGFFQRGPTQLGLGMMMNGPQSSYFTSVIRTNFLFGMPLDRDYNSSGLKREGGFFQRRPTQLGLGMMMNSPQSSYFTSVIRTNFLFGMPLDRDYNSSGLKREGGFFQRRPTQLGLGMMMNSPQSSYFISVIGTNFLFGVLLNRGYSPFDLKRGDGFFQRRPTQLGLGMMNNLDIRDTTFDDEPLSSRIQEEDLQLGLGMMNSLDIKDMTFDDEPLSSRIQEEDLQLGLSMMNSLDIEDTTFDDEPLSSHIQEEDLRRGLDMMNSLDIEDMTFDDEPLSSHIQEEDLRTRTEDLQVKRKILKIALSLTLIITLIVFVRKKWNALPHPSLEIAKKIKTLVPQLKSSGKLYYRKWGFGTGYLKPQND